MRTIVFDLETVPDFTCWFDYTPASAAPDPNAPPPNPLAPPEKKKPGRKPKDSKAEPFPPPHAHAIICIGYCVFEDGIPTTLDAIAGTRESEAALIGGFGAFLKDADAQIVTWNGRAFDIPVLKLRAYRHCLPLGLQDFHRYSGDRHLDLCDVLSDHGVRGMTGYNLDTFSRLIGLPGKDGTDGTAVKGLFDAGKFDAIKNYCRRDVVQTAYVYLRYQAMKALITLEQYRTACGALRKLWHADPSFGTFKVDSARLELA